MLTCEKKKSINKLSLKLLIPRDKLHEAYQKGSHEIFKKAASLLEESNCDSRQSQQDQLWVIDSVYGWLQTNI